MSKNVRVIRTSGIESTANQLETKAGTDLEGPEHARRVYMNLPAANKAIARARMDGLDASIVLCELAPVDGELDD